MSTTGKTDTAATCFCGTDGDVTRLRQLIAAGMDQWEASRLLWSPTDELPPSPTLASTAPGAWATRFVRHTLATALPWLSLPKPTRPEVS